MARLMPFFPIDKMFDNDDVYDAIFDVAIGSYVDKDSLDILRELPRSYIHELFPNALRGFVFGVPGFTGLINSVLDDALLEVEGYSGKKLINKIERLLKNPNSAVSWVFNFAEAIGEVKYENRNCSIGLVNIEEHTDLVVNAFRKHQFIDSMRKSLTDWTAPGLVGSPLVSLMGDLPQRIDNMLIAYSSPVASVSGLMLMLSLGPHIPISPVPRDEITQEDIDFVTPEWFRLFNLSKPFYVTAVKKHQKKNENTV